MGKQSRRNKKKRQPPPIPTAREADAPPPSLPRRTPTPPSTRSATPPPRAERDAEQTPPASPRLVPEAKAWSGAPCWYCVDRAKAEWVPAIVEDRDETDGAVSYRVRLRGKTTTVSEAPGAPPAVLPRNTFPDERGALDVPDLVQLVHLHEPAILDALRQRYDAGAIYTSIGHILLAVNPFRAVEGLCVRRADIRK